MLKGACLCGKVQYEVLALESKMANCHCSMCRKFHGAAFATFGAAKVENFRWLKGKESLKSYTAENGTIRRFCENCGSSLTFSPANDPGKYIEFSLGSLETPILQRPDAHIFVEFKASWYDIKDALPQHPRGRDS